MSEPRYRATPPRWLKAGLTIEEPPAMGAPLPSPPRLVTRVLPVRDEHLMPAPVLRDLIDHTQRLVFVSAQVAAFGPNPDFSDVRTLDKTIQRMATLNVAPFEEGSFVIPAELSDEFTTVEDERGQRQVSSAAVVETFAAMMGSFSANSQTNAINLPIGFIQTVEELGKVIGRHASGLEYHPDTFGTRDPQPIVVDNEFVRRAGDVHRTRRGKNQTGYAAVTGRLVGLDLHRRRIKIQTEATEGAHIVTGVFDPALAEPLVRRMARRLTVFGPAVSRRRYITEITIVEIRDLDESSD